MGTHLRDFSESYPINNNMTGFRWFLKKSLHSCVLDESSLNIGRVSPLTSGVHTWSDILKYRIFLKLLVCYHDVSLSVRSCVLYTPDVKGLRNLARNRELGKCTFADTCVCESRNGIR